MRMWPYTLRWAVDKKAHLCSIPCIVYQNKLIFNWVVCGSLEPVPPRLLDSYSEERYKGNQAWVEILAWCILLSLLTNWLTLCSLICPGCSGRAQICSMSHMKSEYWSGKSKPSKRREIKFVCGLSKCIEGILSKRKRNQWRFCKEKGENLCDPQKGRSYSVFQHTASLEWDHIIMCW